MLRSFLRQLSSSPLDEVICSLWGQHKKSGSVPSIKDLMGTIISLIHTLEEECFLVIDALDEFPLPERPKLLECINELRHWGGLKVHILVISRWEPDIAVRLAQPSSVTIDIEHLIKSDIKIFIEGALLQNDDLRRWDENLKSQIRERLTKFNET